MKNIAAFVDPQIGNPFAGIGILGGGLIAAFVTFRRAIAAMGTLSRTLLGGGLGFMLGGPAGALMGGMMMRGMGGGAAAGLAAGAAGAAAGASWGRQFITAAGGLLRGLPKLALWSIPVDIALQVIESWETVKTRLLAIWEEVKQAAPAWAGGGGQGWGALGQNPEGLPGASRDMAEYGMSWAKPFLGVDAWLRSWTPAGQASMNRFIYFKSMGIDLNDLAEDARLRAQVPDAGGQQAPTNNISGNTFHITVQVASNADPNAIGEAAGNAVQSQLRGLMTDMPAAP